MDRQPHDFAAALAYAQQQAANMQQQQQFGFHPQAQQFPHQMHGGPPFLPPHPSLQQYPPYARPPMPPQGQLYPPHHGPPQLPHQQQGSLPPFSPHAPPHVMSPPPFMHLFDSAPPPPAAPPSDLELQKRIDKLVEYIAKNGPEFEAMIREKQHDNPDYGFLFGGEGNSYYRHKLWLSTRSPSSPFNPSYPLVPPPHNSMLNPLSGTGVPPGLMLGGPQLHQPPFPPFYDPHQQPPNAQPYMAQGHGEYDPSMKSFKGLSGPLPSDVANELNDVLNNLNGTKESIKGAKMWFMQRSVFAPALAESLRERIFALDDPERQLHIIFLANDILFDSLQRRANPRDLDDEALALKPVLGSMLARIYNNPQNKEDNQSRIEKIVQFWGSKEVYDQDTIDNLEHEMRGGLPFPSAAHGSQRVAKKWQVEKSPDQLEEKLLHPASAPLSQFAPSPQFPANQLPTGVYPSVGQTVFPGSLPIQPSVPSQTITAATVSDQNPPPYPLFPPGLIPGMVRKMQIGSGVPYSPLSPLDIPTIIPPSTVPETEILERVSKFFKEIGEANPSEGLMKPSNSNEYDDYERDLPVRKGGACIPPPANLQQVDPETGMHADGSFDSKPGSSSSGRLGLGATANPNEVSQYDDVYTSYRKQRSTSYHSSMSTQGSLGSSR